MSPIGRGWCSDVAGDTPVNVSAQVIVSFGVLRSSEHLTSRNDVIDGFLFFMAEATFAGAIMAPDFASEVVRGECLFLGGTQEVFGFCA